MNSEEFSSFFENDQENISFYVAITTIKKYKVALNMLINSLPKEWKNKYIIVYQEEDNDGFFINKDGHIEVKIKNNIHDYGNWIGIDLLIENNVVKKDSWFLFIHDTCLFKGDNSVKKTKDIINKYHETDIDIIWLCDNGQCNICLIRRNGIKEGKRYKSLMTMNKEDTIHYEWNHDDFYSPKSFNVPQKYLCIPTELLGKRFVYNNINERDVLLYPSIDIEKYYYFIYVGRDTHPCVP